MGDPDRDPTAVRILGALFVGLGTRYDIAHHAAKGLGLLLREDESLRDDAISIWCSIVTTESPVQDQSDGTLADSEAVTERRAGAMRALATLARESPASAPLEIFLAHTDDPDPVVRVYASFALETIARREPTRIRPHVRRLVSTAHPDPNPFGVGVWSAPKRSISSRQADRLVAAKLFRGAVESLFRTETSAAEQWTVLTILAGRLAGNTYDVDDVLPHLLPRGLDFWPAYLALLEEYSEREDPSAFETTCAKTICSRLERTCEDRRDGDIDWTGERANADLHALRWLRRALETVSDPDCSRIVSRGIGDLLRAYTVEQFSGECRWFDVDEKIVHRRLKGDTPIETPADVQDTIEGILESGRDSLPAESTAAETLYEQGVTNLFAESAVLAPSVVRNHVAWIHDVIAATPVTGAAEHEAVLDHCCRALIHVGSAFPESVAPAAPTVRELLRDVVDESRFDVLDSVLGATVVTAERRPVLLEPFGDTFHEWCLDPPDEPDSFAPGVTRRSIRYYAVWGLRFDSTDATERVLEEVANDPDAPERVQDAARTLSDSP